MRRVCRSHIPWAMRQEANVVFCFRCIISDLSSDERIAMCDKAGCKNHSEIQVVKAPVDL